MADGDVLSYTIHESGRIEANLSEKGEQSIDFMCEFFDSFTGEELVINFFKVGSEVYHAIRPSPTNPS